MANTNLIKRTKRVQNFTVVSNSILQSKKMSFEAKGILCYILSLPDDWILHTTKLMSDFNIGRHMLNRCFSEIEEAGYMAKLGMVKGKGGRFEGYNYMFYDTSIKESPYVDFPHAVPPHTDSKHLQRTNNNKELINTKTPISPKGDNSPFEEIDFSIDAWIAAYIRIFKDRGMVRIKEDIDQVKLRRHYNKWVGMGRDPKEPLNALYKILSDNWQRAHNIPDASIPKLFNAEIVAKWNRGVSR